MKKIFILLMIALPAMLATGRAYAQTFTFEGIKYKITSSTEPRTVEVVENTPKYSGNVIIPESAEYSGNPYAVTAIGDNAFIYCFSLKSARSQIP